MTTSQLLLSVSALFLLTTIIVIQIPDEPKPPPEINYTSKARVANRAFIKDGNRNIEIPLFNNEKAILMSDRAIKNLFPDSYENYVYVKIIDGHFVLETVIYNFVSIVGIEKDNRSATYGISGIDIIYFEILD